MPADEYTLKQKISQMFITGFSGTEYNSNKYFKNLLKNALGGVIFFTQNIETKAQITELISNLKKEAVIPMFYSIDQEGGRVERTENIYGGKRYLSAKYAYEKGCDFLKTQTAQIAKELKTYGFNMNFAPVLDVNTNVKNPIIGERAFSSDTQDVISASKIVISEYINNGIIPVGKHFPGHGAAESDSHKTLPVIDIPYDEIYKFHITPFIAAIKNKIPAIMAAHVLYPALEKENIPASVSESIIQKLLIEKLKFNGIVITDDMEMNGIKGYSKIEACTKAINAGVSMFIFRDTNSEILTLIDDIEIAATKGLIEVKKIDSAFQKIISLKREFKIIR
ncbi:MAG: beta-N-acetylhexosaminidase [Candidatus Gastranaerophilales bacterium]|nr:beta-N-acetylhexosaminidase [Candidatus Gastranaerophilales bacterium]